MTVSIIIPTLNEGANVDHAVERAFALNPCEVIVVDGGSTDGTCEIAEHCGAVVIDSPKGRGEQLAAGAGVATGDVLWFLHADCWCVPRARQQLDTALDDPKVEWGAVRQKIDDPKRRYRTLEWGNTLRARRLRTPFGDQAMFVRKSVYDAVGGFRPVPIMEDVDLARRLAKRSAPAILGGPVHISARRWQQQGVVRQTVRNWAMLTAWRCGASPERLAKWYPAP